MTVLSQCCAPLRYLYEIVFFPAGFDEVFPMEKLFLFSPNELQMILCGDQSPQWTREDIINYTEPKLGYTKDR
jgi:E3 ubiquitin-protein ligase HECTD1